MKTRIAIPRLIAITLLSMAALTLLMAAAEPRAPVPAPSVQQKSTGQKQPAVQLSGEQARNYLEQSNDGQSLMQALTVARFGLEWQEHAPGDGKAGGGYLGVSHEQNLNAWFSENGVTVRPTLPEAKRAQAWSMALRLTAYGYGNQLSAVPPIVSRQVKENRIEYQREDQAGASAHLGSRTSHPALTEWYENRAEGIEQGFTLNERPERSSETAARAPQLRSGDALVAESIEDKAYGTGSSVVSNEPLRVLLEVTGDLRAQTKNEGTIELVDGTGKGALSYSKLIAQDADGKKLAARMEASADGREITLVVDDRKASYPIVIDPIVASLEKKLEAFTAQQAEARFGTAVAIDGDRAVVGAWREDFGATVDVGVVYTFTRSGSTWTLSSRNDSGNNANDQCGWSVAISGTRIVYGCPGKNGNTGEAYIKDTANGVDNNFFMFAPKRAAGDRYGTSVAISGDFVVVGAPAHDITTSQLDTGAFHVFRVDAGLAVNDVGFIDNLSSRSNAQLGASVAVEGNTLIAGAPGCGSSTGGCAGIYTFGNSSGSLNRSATLAPFTGSAGDDFGNSVDLSGNTVVVGAWGVDDKGTDAGAAYVFVRDTSGNWSQQQKLTASDGNATNYFSNHAVAIEGNTIVVGAYAWDGGTPPFVFSDDDRGAAYVFMRSGTVWTQQTRILANDGDQGHSFGISVGISGDTVIAGARGATAFGIARAGAAYVYRLDCVPPYETTVRSIKGAELIPTGGNQTICPGSFIDFYATTRSPTNSPVSYQWRKNGVNIPGATSNPYKINSATASDAGSYDVIVSTSCGSDIPSAVILTVHTFSLNPTSQNFGVSGSSGIVNVTATGSCAWTAVSNSSFITVNSGSSGTGNGTVGFSVSANPDPGQRTGTITIAGLTFTISQDGTNCSYSIAPTSQNLGASASTNTVNVTAGAGCAWTATSNDPSFLSINSGASGSGNGTVTYTIATNFDTAQRTGTLTIAGQIFTVTQDGMPTPTPTPTPAGTATTLGNISTRLRVETGDNALIGGFIVTGTQDKKVIIRAIGPSLSLAGKLENPTLELRNSAGTLVKENDDWMNSSPADKQAIIDSTIPPTNDLESAIVATLPSNSSAYTAIVRGANNTTGTGVVEIYDIDRSVDSKLANISTRGLVQTGDTVLIAGTIVLGTSPQKVIIRAIGPSLTIATKLSDPTLELVNGNGTQLAFNDNWRTGGQEAEIIASTVPPTDDSESAIVATLPANGASYTAIVRGVNNSTGIAVVEVYALN